MLSSLFLRIKAEASVHPLALALVSLVVQSAPAYRSALAYRSAPAYQSALALPSALADQLLAPADQLSVSVE